MLRHQLLDLLLAWDDGQGFAADLLEQWNRRHRWSSLDRGLAQSIVYAVLRHMLKLDAWADDLRGGGSLQHETRWILRIGLAQLFILDLAEHAAVNETVSLANGPARGLINALLRRALREKGQLLALAESWPAPLKYSHPKWLFQRWEDQFGRDDALKLCQWNQEPASILVRANLLHDTALPVLDRDKTAHSLPGPGHFYSCDVLPRQMLADGLIYVQDPATWLACSLLQPQPGEFVLDLCAAPGGKSAILGQMMGNRGTLWATDANSDRLPRLRENLGRLGVSIAEIARFDVLKDQYPPWGGVLADRILLDVPCSNTGVMRRRIDVRWRLAKDEIAALAKTQVALVRHAQLWLKHMQRGPGGKRGRHPAGLGGLPATGAGPGAKPASLPRRHGRRLRRLSAETMTAHLGARFWAASRIVSIMHLRLLLPLFLTVSLSAQTPVAPPASAPAPKADEAKPKPEAKQADLQRSPGPYKPGPDSEPKPGVPQGTVTKLEWTESKNFPGTTRDYWVYVPAQYDGKTPANVMVWQDGGGAVNPKGALRVPVVMDNLIAAKEMPVTIAIFIDPGKKTGQKPGDKPSNRSFEYDSVNDTYAKFLLEEILPEVGKKYKLTDDPEGRAIAGGSSGGICAFNVAWQRPGQFRKVFSWIGSFTNIRGGNVYPDLVLKAEKKPIRVFLQDGKNDIVNQFGSWPEANLKMVAALKEKGYDYQFVQGEGGHNPAHAGQILPDVLRWLWKK